MKILGDKSLKDLFIIKNRSLSKNRDKEFYLNGPIATKMKLYLNQ